MLKVIHNGSRGSKFDTLNHQLVLVPIGSTNCVGVTRCLRTSGQNLWFTILADFCNTHSVAANPLKFPWRVFQFDSIICTHSPLTRHASIFLSHSPSGHRTGPSILLLTVLFAYVYYSHWLPSHIRTYRHPCPRVWPSYLKAHWPVLKLGSTWSIVSLPFLQSLVKACCTLMYCRADMWDVSFSVFAITDHSFWLAKVFQDWVRIKSLK